MSNRVQAKAAWNWGKSQLNRLHLLKTLFRRYGRMLCWSFLIAAPACLQMAAQTDGASAQPDSARALAEPPEVRSPVVLTAINDPATGKTAFLFNGSEEPPVIRAAPGQHLRVTYINKMDKHSQEQCVHGLCMNMSNLHFHGLHVSPNAPQDDVLTMMAMPGETLQYVVDIPADQAPGLYWYHTHPHGESYQQDLDGMSGAIVIDGIERYVPEIRNMRERVLVLRDRVFDDAQASAAELRSKVEIPAAGCRADGAVPTRILTVNGTVRPQIAIAPGERQFWRIVNASPDLYADIEVDDQEMEIVALDGMPLAFHDPTRRTERARHVLVSPAGRLEVIVTGPAPGSKARMRSHCFDTGPDGDPNPAMVLADLVNAAEPGPVQSKTPKTLTAAVQKPLAASLIAKLEDRPADFVVTFTEDSKGFYINGKKFGATDPPMITVKVGSYHNWRIVNNSKEVHPFHIHQVHFLAFAENGNPLAQAEWLDTVNVPVGGSVDLVMDFTDPIIRGVSLFHCHLLKHEDKGMMAKILFE